MKVKNIMFSGFMAAVLAGACGAADAATVLASKEFVTTELGKKQDTLTAGTNIAIDPETNTISSTYEYNDSELSEKVADLETTIGASEEALGGKTIVEYIDDKTKGFESDGVVSELQTDVETLQNAMGELPEGKTVAQAIADAVYDDTALAGRVSANEANIAANSLAITGLESSKADKTALNAYVTSDALSGMGYQTAENVATAIGNANIAMEKVTGLSAALGEKAAASDVESLQTTVEGFTNKTTGIAATYATKSELAGYATDGELAEVSAVAAAAQTAAQVKATVEGYGYQTATQVDNAITAKGYATTTYVDNQDAATLQAAKDDAADTYQVKGDYMVDPATKGTYLVTRAEDGSVSYSAVQVVGPNDTIVLQ